MEMKAHITAEFCLCKEYEKKKIIIIIIIITRGLNVKYVC